MTAELSLETGTAPDFAAPFEAWRVWRVVVDRSGCRLGSVIKPTLWPRESAFVADCLRIGHVSGWFRRWRGKAHVAPETNCECGIYAAGLRECAQYLNDSPLEPKTPRVIGRVSLWGTVVECERGFRASHAYPLQIYVPADVSTAHGGWEELVDGLAVYGVPIELLPVRRTEAIDALEQLHVATSRPSGH